MSEEDLTFHSSRNYQKIVANGTTVIDTGAVSPGATIPHNLGYRPNAKCWMTNNSGEYYPMIENLMTIVIFEFPTDAILNMTNDHFGTFHVNTTNLVIKLYGGAGALVSVRYRIYLDSVDA